MEIVFVTRAQPLRIGSAVSRALDHVESVHVLMLEDDEKTASIASDAGARVYQHTGGKDAPALAKRLLEVGVIGRALIIGLDNSWKLRDLPSMVSSSRRALDVQLYLKSLSSETNGESDNRQAISIDHIPYSDAIFQHATVTSIGMRAIAEQNSSDSPKNLPMGVGVRIVELPPPAGAAPPASLTTATGFMRLLYWMLESRHPLILFGIPGLVLFWVGYQMVEKLINVGGPYDTVSLGVALAAFAATFVGVFSLTTSLILYVLGKQVERIQAEFSRTLES